MIEFRTTVYIKLQLNANAYDLDLGLNKLNNYIVSNFKFSKNA